ncbi:MAG: DinB family protein [Phycisphaeraceae bacterium]|jgi:uncharacterized damage-inducible protein DinB|nr:DinB family protein [Phycisphaeraceae bacterium]
MAKALSTDPYAILLGHNRWGIAQIIERCRGLSHAEFHKKFEIGPGTLHDTIGHMIVVMHRWADEIAERPMRPRLDGRASYTDPAPAKQLTPVEFMAQLDEVAADFAAVVAAVRADGRINSVRELRIGDDPPQVFTVAAAIIHVTNHGMHHRGQCMNMLRHLGRPVNADLDELEWQFAREP